MPNIVQHHLLNCDYLVVFFICFFWTDDLIKDVTWTNDLKWNCGGQLTFFSDITDKVIIRINNQCIDKYIIKPTDYYICNKSSITSDRSLFLTINKMIAFVGKITFCAFFAFVNTNKIMKPIDWYSLDSFLITVSQNFCLYGAQRHIIHKLSVFHPCICFLSGSREGVVVEAHCAARARLWREVCGNGNHLSYWSRYSQGSRHTQTHSCTHAHTHTQTCNTNWLTHTEKHGCVAETDPLILIPFTFP